MIKITPQTYIDMNKELEEDGTMLRITVPTQEQIDKWQEESRKAPHIETPPQKDMVAEMWEKIGIYTSEEREEYKNKTHFDRRK
tara:strand:- start:16912 stop:17163 length:252 start_codon:yes stop_codon:yes gene_type:complete